MSSHYTSWYCYKHIGMSLALRITFCSDNWKRLTGHHFTLMSRGAHLPVTTVTIDCLLESTRDTKEGG